MPVSEYVHPLFGRVKFKTHSDVWVRGDKITFLSGFDPKDVTKIHVPQLVGVKGTADGNIRFHKNAHKQLLQVFEDLQQLDLLKYIKQCAGSLNLRLRKPVRGGLSKLPSNHAFGIAIDLNSDDGSLGASVAPVAPVFEALGFKWGIAFDDPMHFEVEEFIAQPVAISPHLTAIVDEHVLPMTRYALL